MRKTILFGTFFLAAFALLGFANLTSTCLEGTVGNGDDNNGNCAAGRVSFSGSGFPATVHINVSRNSTGEVIDDYDYEAAGGTIEFTETLVPADTYSVRLTGANGLTVTRNVTTGSN
jgi:hypothetical protein